MSSACRSIWSAAATLPQQPCSRSDAGYAVDPAGHRDAMCIRHDHSVMNEITSTLIGKTLAISLAHVSSSCVCRKDSFPGGCTMPVFEMPDHL
ncbi:MAG TPA: hypothetical protein DEF43_00095 [Chloroflexus aurantiacus]|nr:hypothetical protein [Chloroflexus aurantiacus]